MSHNLYETPGRKTASPEIWVRFADFQAEANHAVLPQIPRIILKIHQFGISSDN
jgi:cytochrome c556